MSSMDLEKLKMTGAGRAVAVLTSGGDAQGDLKRNLHIIKTFYLHVLENMDQPRGGRVYRSMGACFYIYMYIFLFTTESIFVMTVMRIKKKKAS